MTADSVAVAAEHAERARQATAQRNAAIRAAVTAGASLRAIGAACDMSHTAVGKIARAGQ